jgi:hypothetical protein
VNNKKRPQKNKTPVKIPGFVSDLSLFFEAIFLYGWLGRFVR